MNRTLTLALAAYVNPEHSDLEKHLSGAVSAINTVRQSSTEKSPFKLVYRRLPVQQIENGISWPPERAELHSEFINRVVVHRKKSLGPSQLEAEDQRVCGPSEESRDRIQYRGIGVGTFEQIRENEKVPAEIYWSLTHCKENLLDYLSGGRTARESPKTSSPTLPRPCLSVKKIPSSRTRRRRRRIRFGQTAGGAPLGHVHLVPGGSRGCGIDDRGRLEY